MSRPPGSLPDASKFAGAVNDAMPATTEPKWSHLALEERDADAAPVVDLTDPGQAAFKLPPALQGPRQ